MTHLIDIKPLYEIARYTAPFPQVAAPARAGAIAPVDVTVEAQNTGMGPEKTSFFQALNISTKIAKGCIEIVSSVHLVGFLIYFCRVFSLTHWLDFTQYSKSGLNLKLCLRRINPVLLLITAQTYYNIVICPG